MRYTISFAVILYAVSAIIDAILGMKTVNPHTSFTLWVASATAIAAICIYIVNKGEPTDPLPFFLFFFFLITSIALSIVAFIFGYVDSVNILNIAIKASATVLTVKPEIVEIEITTENEEKS